MIHFFKIIKINTIFGECIKKLREIDILLLFISRGKNPAGHSVSSLKEVFEEEEEENS